LAINDPSTLAVVMEGPGRLTLRHLALTAPAAQDLVVDVDFSGISSGTERLLWTGRMPAFPGMGYPLVPGYESVGTVIDAGDAARHRIGETVFVPGASCFKDARGLFGGAARRIVVNEARAISLPEALAERGVLLALAATAQHALAGGPPPQLIVGHGVLGRLLARLTLAAGHEPPVVWERNALRRGAEAYPVIDPSTDQWRSYEAIFDASGDAGLLDTLVGGLAKGGEIVLAGFYEDRIGFAFAPAFMKEARFRIAAEFRPEDLVAVRRALDEGRLSFDGLITHRRDAAHASDAYATAFTDPACLKMVIDWRSVA
jgi:3-hydroxyethyl bacteriochlorophyllide a dehydrogenase